MNSLYITRTQLSEDRDNTDNRILLIWGHIVKQTMLGLKVIPIVCEPITPHYMKSDSIFMCENINRPERQHSTDPHRAYPGEHWIVEHVSFPNDTDDLQDLPLIF